MVARVAFIGLGNMGSPMARNLLMTNFQLWAFDVSSAALKTIEEAGANVVADAREAVEKADFAISMLPASEQVESLYLGAQGILDAMPSSCIAIDCSTIAPAMARKVAAAARQRSIRMLDAPVSGGVTAAKDGTLTFIVGGPAAVLNASRMVLEFMGINIIHAGGPGAGQTAKICNNMLLAIQMAGTAEALHLGVANGLDPKVLSEIMKRSSGGNWTLNLYNPYPGVMPNVPASKGYRGGFMVQHMIKDLGLAEATAKEVGAAIPMGDRVRALYQELQAADEGAVEFDFSIIQRLYDPEIMARAQSPGNDEGN